MSLRHRLLWGIARVGTVLCLLLAAVVLAANASEYPGYTRSALRYMTSEVLPLVFVGLVNLAALDGSPRRTRQVGLSALALNLVLLVHALTAVRAGAPPLAFMLAGVAGMLVVGSLGQALTSHRLRTAPIAIAWLLLLASYGSDGAQSSDASELVPRALSRPSVHRPDELTAAATDVVGFLQGKVPFARIRLTDTVTLQLSREGGGRPRRVARERLRDPSSWHVRSNDLPHARGMTYSFVPHRRLTVLTTRVGRHLNCLEYDLSSVAPELAPLPHVGTMLSPIGAEYESCLNTHNMTLVFASAGRPPTLVAAVYDQWEW